MTSELRLLDDVRAQAYAIADSARFVAIDMSAIEEYAASLIAEHPAAPELDAETHFLGEHDATLSYVITLDAINFGSGYFPHLRKRAGMSGYFTVASSLKDYFEVHGPPTADDLKRITIWDCARIFGQTLEDGVTAELMGLFARALNDLGAYLSARFDGRFGAVVDAAGGSAERLARLLVEMPFYRDLGFYKRAQLTAADLAASGVAEFEDLHRLTIFADNLVPHVLRMDGVLRYDAGLLERIENEELIPAGSAEEREIRGCAVHAVELIRESSSSKATSMQLDYILWNRGQAPEYKARPRHRTRTVFY
jgi:Potential Queuosine, Q, salvage protein family